MREMTWIQYDYAEIIFYRDIRFLDEQHSELLASLNIKSLADLFWFTKDYISPRIVKPYIHFYAFEIPSEVMYLILLTFSNNFREYV